MSYIIFIDGRKHVRKYVESLSKEDCKETYFITLSQDLERKLFPKKSEVGVCNLLLPPPDIMVNYITHKDTKKFQEKYYRYLTRPLCKAALNKIAKLAFLEDYNVVVCFGDIETEFNILKYVRKSFECIFSDIEVFTYKDWKNNPRSVYSYRQENKDEIIHQIIEGATVIGAKLKELDSCSGEYEKHEFYNEK